MLALMFLGMPIGLAMGLVGFLGFAWVSGWNAAINMLSLAPYSSVANYVLTVVPLFVLMGHIANETGIGRELYATAQTWLRHRRGGLRWRRSPPARASPPSAAPAWRRQQR